MQVVWWDHHIAKKKLDWNFDFRPIFKIAKDKTIPWNFKLVDIEHSGRMSWMQFLTIKSKN